MRRRRDFEVVGAGFFEVDDDDDDEEALLAPLQVVRDASLTALRRAVAKYARRIQLPSDKAVEMRISEDAPESFIAEDAVYLATRLRITADEVVVVAESPTTALPQSSDPVVRLLRPLVKARRCRVASVMRIEGSRGDALEVEVEVPTHGRTVGDALAIGDDVRRLLEAAFATGPLRPSTAADLLRTGHHEVLIGQPESDWLEAKSRLYELDEVGRFHLACDVAAFANAGGGVIAIGLQTAKVRGRHIISCFRGIPLERFNLAAHQAVLRTWIYPHPHGVRFDLALTDHNPDIGLVVIEVPAQPIALKPFFVRRAQLAGRIRTENFVVPIRAGDATSPWDLVELHALIVAGRAALAQGGEETKIRPTNGAGTATSRDESGA